LKGFIINFEAFDDDARIKLYHMLFGRNVYRNYRGKRYAYYTPGMLDKTPFLKVIERRIFVTSMVNIYVEQLKIFGNITVDEVERDYPMEKLTTGEDYWHNMAQEKGLDFKRQIRTRRPKCRVETGQKGIF
jgi:hypothetical protein